ncbi:GMC oxidoreductase-domain-containing protein [Amanita rubescens]|nr:GMC oxidoreductase-domain-containing protein [Amanita rubescens]
MTITNSPELDFDIIFAGGGAAACITAGRLAAADTSLKILIIEDGPETRDKSAHIHPARMFSNIMNPALGVFHYHKGRVSDALGGRAPIVATGRCLGGGSAINLMMYTRAAASDYDDWEKTFKNPGWGSSDLIPLLQKTETYFDQTVPFHGYKGPLKVSCREDQINVAEQFLDVVGKYDKERPLTNDINSFFSCNAYGRWPHYIDQETGRRSDTAHHYIYNQIDTHGNLKVYCGQRVVRVLFEGTRAVGVEYINGAGGQVAVAKASRLVILSAGAFGSPTILQRSGIGSEDILKKNNIKQIIDLPGVGEHYMDHALGSAVFHASDDADTLDLIWGCDEEARKPFIEQWSKTGKGLLAHNGVDAGIKMRPGLKDLREIGPEFESRWQNLFVPVPDKPVLALALLAGTPRPVPEKSTKNLTAFYYVGYPDSVGFVRITSGTDAYAPLDFHPGFLESPADLALLRWGYKKGREILRRMKSYRGENASAHPKFLAGSAAEAKYLEGPVDIGAADIAYSKEDDEAIDRFHREIVGTAYHSIGTCAMKPREEGGVVDPRLNVYGTQCLKVADCSIAPGNVGANTYNTATAIGEKAVILIAQDLGIQGL